MRIVPPKPFTFEGGKRAVLMLHGFTGNTADVRMLGRYLQDKGYTCHAPLYKGHGVPPEQLLETGPEDWWQDVVGAYEYLQEKGYDEIAVVGLSLGGVFSLKVGYTFPVKGIVPMCTPITAKTEEKIYQGVLEYAREYKQLQRKSEDEIEKEMAVFREKPAGTLMKIRDLIHEVASRLDQVTAPLFVVQARNDEMIDATSAEIIHDKAGSQMKSIKWYENASHVITLSDAKQTLHRDVHEFLQQLDWRE